MYAATRFALRFAYAAAATVAIGTVVAELTADTMDNPFAPPPFGVTTLVFAVGTFVWSYMVAAGIAWHLKGMEECPEVYPLVGGALFALLTPLLGYLLDELAFPAFAISMALWVLLFPALVVVTTWWRLRSITSLERARAR